MKDRLVAHRGNAVEFRENSILAIQSAIDLGVRYIEFDVQMSADGVPVLLHDGYLGRLYGKDRDAVDTRLAALLGFGVASLEQAVELLGRHHDVAAFVEIKSDGFAKFSADQVVTSVCESIDPLQCIVISFDPDAVMLARRKGFRVGVIVKDLSNKTLHLLHHLRPEFAFCDQRIIKMALPDGPIWASYEVSDIETAQRLDALGVHLFETMSVRKMVALQ